MHQKENKILVLTYWDYNNALIQTYTLPYVKLIAGNPNNSKIFLVTLERTRSGGHDTGDKKIENISLLYRPYGLTGLYMWLKTLLKLRSLIRREKINVIHAWCTPAGMIGYLLSILTRTTLIIDSYEPHAEAMVENGEWKRNSLSFWLLSKFERLQTKRAKYLIAAAPTMTEYAKEKFGHTKNNIFVKPACVDLKLFSEKNKKKNELLIQLGLKDCLVCVYAGKFGGIYLDKEVFDFFKQAELFWGNKFKALILSSHSGEEIESYRKNSNLNKDTIIHRFIPHSEIADYIGLGDFGITPVKSVPSKKHCSPIKDGEYWALGLPVVITPNISNDSTIIAENKIGSVLEDLDKDAYLRSVMEIDKLLTAMPGNELYKKIRPIAEKFRNFEIAKNIYQTIYKERID